MDSTLGPHPLDDFGDGIGAGGRARGKYWPCQMPASKEF
jgi:hypothetical protein